MIEVSLIAFLAVVQGSPVPKHGGVVLGIAVDQAAKAGVDYRRALKKAYAGDSTALAPLFRATPYMDGAGATLNSGVLEDLLRQFGDTTFSATLARQPRKITERVIDDLDFAFAMHDKQPDWSRKFPTTYRLGSHRSAKLYRRNAP